MLDSDVGELLVSLSSVLFICLLVLVEASDFINTENLLLVYHLLRGSVRISRR